MELDKFRNVDLVINHVNDNFFFKQFVSQNDNDGRTLTVQVTSEGIAGKIPGLSLNLRWSNQANGLTDLSAFECIDANNSIFQIFYPDNMLNPGKVIASIQIIQDGKVSHSKQFEITVQKLAGEAKGIVSKAEYSALVKALSESNGLKTEISKKADRIDLIETNAELANKADKEYVDDKLNSIVSGSPKETFNTLAELKAKYPQGAEGIYVVLADGQWYYWHSTSLTWKAGGQYTQGDSSDVYFPATNLIKNGNFTNGLNGFSIYGGIGKVEANTLKVTGNGTLGAVGAYTTTANSFLYQENHQMYFKCRTRVLDSECKYIRFYAASGSDIYDLTGKVEQISSPLNSTWYDVSIIFTLPQILVGKNVQIYVLAYYANSATANGKQFEFWRPATLDLTAVFGEGLEPRKNEIEKYLSKYDHSWFAENNQKFVSVKDVFAEMLTRNDEIKSENIFDDFTNSQWNVDSVGTQLSKVTDKVVTGKKSLQLDADGTQTTSINIDRSTITKWDLVGVEDRMMIRVWIEDVTLIQTLTVYLCNDDKAWSDYCKFIFVGGGTSQTNLKNGWNYLSLILSNADLINNFSFNKTIKKIRISVTPKKDGDLRVVFDSLSNKILSEPKIVITFDDGWKTVHENAFPIMQERGIRATVYAIGQYVDNPDNPLSPFFMSLADYKEIYRQKWHIGNHTWQHNYYFGGGHTPKSYLEVLNKNREWLIDNDLGDGGDYVCYPNGEYDQRVINLMRVNNYKSARCAKIRGIHPEKIDDQFQIISEAFSYTTTVADAKKWIDDLVENGGTLFLQFHSIPIDDTIHGPDDPTVGYQNKYISFSKEKFIEVMDYIVEKGLVDNCLTHEEWFRKTTRGAL